jgi:hypothetical protein
MAVAASRPVSRGRDPDVVLKRMAADYRDGETDEDQSNTGGVDRRGRRGKRRRTAAK